MEKLFLDASNRREIVALYLLFLITYLPNSIGACFTVVCIDQIVIYRVQLFFYILGLHSVLDLVCF